MTEINKYLKIEELKKLAEQGDADVEFHLGERYCAGVRGVHKDESEARKWFHSAALKGHGTAQYAFGVMLCKGMGGERDLNTGIRWIMLSASQGNTYGCALMRKFGSRLADQLVLDETPSQMAVLSPEETVKHAYEIDGLAPFCSRPELTHRPRGIPKHYH